MEKCYFCKEEINDKNTYKLCINHTYHLDCLIILQKQKKEKLEIILPKEMYNVCECKYCEDKLMDLDFGLIKSFNEWSTEIDMQRVKDLEGKTSWIWKKVDFKK